jgi:hypothetical protein
MYGVRYIEDSVYIEKGFLKPNWVFNEQYDFPLCKVLAYYIETENTWESDEYLKSKYILWMWTA